MNFGEFPMQMNFEKILEAPQFSAMTKQVIHTIMKTPYMSLGEFFSKLNNNDLTALNIIVELAIYHHEGQPISDLIVMSTVLAQAEGAGAMNEQEATEQINHFATLITCESLARKGLVKVYHENFSFGQDMRNKVIVERID